MATSEPRELCYLIDITLQGRWLPYARRVQRIADGSLVVLVGPPVSGKSTWAAAHFAADEIVSSDRLRNRRWVVRDVNIEGISLVANYRSQFDRVIGLLLPAAPPADPGRIASEYPFPEAAGPGAAPSTPHARDPLRLAVPRSPSPRDRASARFRRSPARSCLDPPPPSSDGTPG